MRVHLSPQCLHFQFNSLPLKFGLFLFALKLLKSEFFFQLLASQFFIFSF